jgi:prepilin-type processing-associated H-X9-DG protein
MPLEFQCPSNPNDIYRFGAQYFNGNQMSQTSDVPLYAQSAYRAMVATCAHSLVYGYGDTTWGYVYRCSDDTYTNRVRHPDGGMPAVKYGAAPFTFRDITDGLAHTILAVETYDNYNTPPTAPVGFDRGGWVFPPACALYGMVADRNGSPGSPYGGFFISPNPSNGDSTWPCLPYNAAGHQDIKMVRCWGPFGAQYTAAGNTYNPFITPLRTFLAFDFLHADAGSYAIYNASTNGGNYRMAAPTGNWPTSAVPTQLAAGSVLTLYTENPACGPSSGHPGGVNHLFGDGSVKTLARDTDVATYWYLITRAGHDPAPNVP